MKIRDKIEEVISELDFSFNVDITESSYELKDIRHWFARLENLSLGLDFDPDNPSDFVSMSTLITVMRESLFKIISYASILKLNAENKISELDTAYKLQYDELIVSSELDTNTKIKTVAAKEAFANSKLAEQIKELNKWKRFHLMADSLFDIAKSKEDQVRNTWFYVKYQWDSLLSDKFGGSYDGFDSSRASKVDIPKVEEPPRVFKKPTFIEAEVVDGDEVNPEVETTTDSSPPTASAAPEAQNAAESDDILGGIEVSKDPVKNMRKVISIDELMGDFD